MNELEKIKDLGVPRNSEETEELLDWITDLEHKIQSVNAVRNERLQAINKEADARIAELEKAVEMATGYVHKFAEKNRKELTANNKRKSAAFSLATLRWRLPKAKLVITGKEKEVIDELRQKGYNEFVRLEPKLEKEKLKKRPDIVKLLSRAWLSQEEYFEIVLNKVKKVLSLKLPSRQGNSKK